MPKLDSENYEHWKLRSGVTPEVLEDTLRRVALEWRGLVQNNAIDTSKCLEHDACPACEITALIEAVFTLPEE